jgi:hypothetical protein
MTVVVSIASMSCRASAGSSTGVLPRRTTWRGPRTAAAGLVGSDLADHHPIEQVAQGGQAQLRRRRGSLALQLLDVGGDMHALDRRDLRGALRLNPIEEFRRRVRISAARVRVPDLRGEEFEETIGSTRAGGCDKGGGV